MSARGGTGLIGGYAPILQRIGKKGDYLGREPEVAIDMDESGGWVEERWTFVTFAISVIMDALSHPQETLSS
jgi:hypothetical protein